MHVGNVFAALLAWLGARSANGSLVLRIEDLDPRASKPQNSQLLIDDLRWLGLDWDEGPYYQSDRRELYVEALESLRKRSLTYPCFCTRAELHTASAPHASDGTYIYPGTCRNLSRIEVERRLSQRAPGIRLRVPTEQDPTGTISFDDVVCGPHTETLALDCGDFLVRRSDGVMAYQLAVVVDDALMGVNQVVRGNDLLGSTARQIYLQRLLGYAQPTYAHVPLIVSLDGRRLSKRDRDMDLGAIRAREKSPERLLGWLASSIGLAERGEAVSARALVERFAWNVVAQHAQEGTIVANHNEFLKLQQ